jgi:metal-responsive CopG/Arc/MetJ family transcriptional regulator
MTSNNVLVRKITVSLPEELVEFADQEAARQDISRSRVIAHALERIKIEEEEHLAAEGYLFYTKEASAFAEASAAATAEALDNDG